MYMRLSIDGRRVPLIRQPNGRLRLVIYTETDSSHAEILTLEVERSEDGSLMFWVSEYQGATGTEPWRVAGRVPGVPPTPNRGFGHTAPQEAPSGDSEALMRHHYCPTSDGRCRACGGHVLDAEKHPQERVHGRDQSR